MSTVATNTRYTPEDLLAMPQGVDFELVNGELVRRNMGFRSSRVGGRVFRLMDMHSEANGLGWVLPADVGYQCFPDDPINVRKPDVSFIRRERLLAHQEPEGYARIAPDLAVEVVSPNDLFEELAEKVEEYLAAGVRLVWVVDPTAQRVLVYRADGTGTILRADDELSGEDVLPGFRCRVGDLFLVPAGVREAASGQ
jgi:Uma2 family endonuclease